MLTKSTKYKYFIEIYELAVIFSDLHHLDFKIVLNKSLSILFKTYPDIVSLLNDFDNNYKVVELKSELKYRNLPINGKKMELINRLNNHNKDLLEVIDFELINEYKSLK